MTLNLSLIITLGSLLTGCQNNEVKPAPATVSSEAITLLKSGVDQRHEGVLPAKLDENTPVPTSSRENAGDYPLEPSRLPVASTHNQKYPDLTPLEP